MREAAPPARTIRIACAAAQRSLSGGSMPEHLSVVMPVYNERYLVAESIRRLLAVESPLISRLDLFDSVFLARSNQALE